MVNALSEFLEVEVKRDGSLYRQRYECGEPVTALEPVDTVGKRNTGTRVCCPRLSILTPRRWPWADCDICYAPGSAVPRPAYEFVCGGQAREASWLYKDGLRQYGSASACGCVPQTGMHQAKGNAEAVEYALKWVTMVPYQQAIST